MRTVRHSSQRKGRDTNGMGKESKCNSSPARGLNRQKSKSSDSTRDMVIRCDEKIEWIVDKLKTHCARHWYIEGAIILAALGYLGNLVANMITHLANTN